MTTYQDAWINGAASLRGYRECSLRYAAVRDALALRFGQQESIAVCDIGANMSYFGIRLAEDFPAVRVLGFEFHQFEMRQRHLARCGVADRVRLINRKVSLTDLAVFSHCMRFDAVLALSVLHHQRESVNAWLGALLSLGRIVLAEYAVSDSRRGHQSLAMADDVRAIKLGDFRSHLSETVRRPMYLIERMVTE